MSAINAPLLEGFMTACTLLDRVRTADGLGGFTETWTDGAAFDAAIVKDSTLEARTAEKAGVTEVYNVYTGTGTVLDYHDVFRREKDGAIFRVTSNAVDSMAPKMASFAFAMVTAERWTLT